jgi:hypothetical protein
MQVGNYPTASSSGLFAGGTGPKPRDRGEILWTNKLTLLESKNMAWDLLFYKVDF